MQISKSTPVLFDTNVLAYNQDVESPFYEKASLWHLQALKGKITAVIASQNFLELSAIMINPKKIKRPLSKTEVIREINIYQQSGAFKLICPKPDTLTVYASLLDQVELKSPLQTFDIFLAATMFSNNIKHILTANTKDFIMIPQLEVLDLLQ